MGGHESGAMRQNALDQFAPIGQSETTARRSWTNPFTPPENRQLSLIHNSLTGVPVLTIHGR